MKGLTWELKFIDGKKSSTSAWSGSQDKWQPYDLTGSSRKRKERPENGGRSLKVRLSCGPRLKEVNLLTDFLILVNGEAFLSQFHALMKQLNGQLPRDDV